MGNSLSHINPDTLLSSWQTINNLAKAAELNISGVLVLMALYNCNGKQVKQIKNNTGLNRRWIFCQLKELESNRLIVKKGWKYYLTLKGESLFI